MTPDQIRADDDDSDRVHSTFDRADNTARLALELAEAKREVERLRAEVESRGEQICSLVDQKAVLRDEVVRLGANCLDWMRRYDQTLELGRELVQRTSAAEAKVARVEALADELDQMAHQQSYEVAGVLWAIVGRLRAALADAPAEQRAEGGAWRDRHGDVWTEGADGLLHTTETQPFPREHVEKKWGPLTPADGDGRG